MDELTAEVEVVGSGVGSVLGRPPHRFRPWSAAAASKSNKQKNSERREERRGCGSREAEPEGEDPWRPD